MVPVMFGLAHSFGAVLAVIVLTVVAERFWDQPVGGGEAARMRRLWAFVGWWLKGVLVPLTALWVLSTGWLSGIPPVIGQQGTALPGTGAWVMGLPDRLAGWAVIMASWWCAVTLGWLAGLAWSSIEPQEGLGGVVLFWCVVTLPVAALVLWAGGLEWLGVAAMVPLGAVLNGVAPFREVKPVNPMYSRAIGLLKLGHTVEAEQAVLRELEVSPDDYAGWMLLAELYAEHFHDLELADETVHQLCDQPGLKGIQVALALQRLAEWHLKIGEDPASARRALLGIETRMPESHFARMAIQRMRQLPADRDELREQKQTRTIPLPALRDPLDENRRERNQTPLPRVGVAAKANRLVARLERNPNDPEPREELARLLADRLDRVEEGMEQVRLLLAMPDRPAERVPEWLALLAAWSMRRTTDRDSARPFLEELVRDYPDSAQALAARRRLNVMDLARAARG